MNQPVEVLLVEDDEDDVELMREALKDSKLLINLATVGDGVEAMAYLRRQPPYAGVKRPDLILLDLNMPRKDGREVLQEVKNDAGLKSIPVVVLTTSDAEEDILKSYDLGTNCFITKPVGFEQLCRVVRHIEDFWFTVVKLPKR